MITGFEVLDSVVTNSTLVAIAILVAGLFIAKAIAIIMTSINTKTKIISNASLKSLTRLIELLIFLIFVIVALGILQVKFAKDVIVKIGEIIPSVLIILLLLLLGYILINLVVDVLKGFFLRIGRQDYLIEFGISPSIINSVFIVLKVFLYIVLLSITLNYYAQPVPFFDSIITATVFALVFFSMGLVAYSFKDYAANLLLAKQVEKSIVKSGQRIKFDFFEGDVISVTNHGVVIESDSGYNYIIPNKNMFTKEIMVKRVRSNISKIESLMKNFTPQLPSHCGPASSKMMLDFFGYDIGQEELAKEAKTQVPGGTEPEDLIAAVKKVTNSEVRGKLINFDEIFNLAQEVKSWIAEGALVVLWYKKPVIFPKKQSKSGHYVLCVGVEGEELIIMDPSSETAGVYMVNNHVLEDAMDEYDKARGYIVFAKKGTSAFWRLSEGLIYGDVSSYSNLSKSFERYLKRQFRQRNMINELISEHLFTKDDEKAKHVWKPDLTASKTKQKKEKETTLPEKEEESEDKKKKK